MKPFATFASFLCLDFSLLWAPSNLHVRSVLIRCLNIVIFPFTSIYPLTIYLFLPLCIWLFSLGLSNPVSLLRLCRCIHLTYSASAYFYCLANIFGSSLSFLFFCHIFLAPSFRTSVICFVHHLSLLLLLLSLLTFFLPPPTQPRSAFFSLVDQTVEAAKLPEARADRGAALSDLPPSLERQTNADTPISCKETIIHHLYQLSVFLS